MHDPATCHWYDATLNSWCTNMQASRDVAPPGEQYWSIPIDGEECPWCREALPSCTRHRGASETRTQEA